MSFEPACAVSDVGEDEAFALSLGGVDLAIARDGDTFYALQDLCSHAAVPLSDGEVADCAIECFLHGSTFDLRTGQPTCLPATLPVATFPTEVRGDQIWVDPTTTLNGVTPS